MQKRFSVAWKAAFSVVSLFNFGCFQPGVDDSSDKNEVDEGPALGSFRHNVIVEDAGDAKISLLLQKDSSATALSAKTGACSGLHEDCDSISIGDSLTIREITRRHQRKI